MIVSSQLGSGPSTINVCSQEDQRQDGQGPDRDHDSRAVGVVDIVLRCAQFRVELDWHDVEERAAGVSVREGIQAG
jgi:hypothetical protein